MIELDDAYTSRGITRRVILRRASLALATPLLLRRRRGVVGDFRAEVDARIPVGVCAKSTDFFDLGSKLSPQIWPGISRSAEGASTPPRPTPHSISWA